MLRLQRSAAGLAMSNSVFLECLRSRTVRMPSCFSSRVPVIKPFLAWGKASSPSPQARSLTALATFRFRTGAPVSRQECRFPILRIEFEPFSAADLEEIRNHSSDFRFWHDGGCICPNHELGG